MYDLDFEKLEYAPVSEPVYVIGPQLEAGGVAVHVQRRAALLRRNGQRHRVVDRAQMTPWQTFVWLLRILLHPAPAVYEVNALDTAQMTALRLRPFPKRIIYRVHSGQFLRHVRGLRKRLLKGFLRAVDLCVLEGPHLPAFFRDNGFSIPDTVVTGHAFLPPDESREAAIWADYDPGLVRFLRAHGPVMLVYGYDLKLCDGELLYGIDLAVEAAARLRSSFPDLGLVIGLPVRDDAEKLAALAAQIEALGLSKHVYLKKDTAELWPLLRRVDVLLRPTNTDGDSVLVREALYLGCPVVASNVCPRPPGTVLFRNRDAADLAAQARTVLAEHLAETVPAL